MSQLCCSCRQVLDPVAQGIKYHNIREVSPEVLETAIAAASSISDGLRLLGEGWSIDEIMDVSRFESALAAEAGDRLNFFASDTLVAEVSVDKVAKGFLVGSFETMFGLDPNMAVVFASEMADVKAGEREKQGKEHSGADLQVRFTGQGAYTIHLELFALP
jgi:hypothetical protein